MRYTILGVHVDSLSHREFIEQTQSFLMDGRQHFLITPNPEILLAAAQSPSYRHVLNHADLAVPDGIGLKYANLFLRGKKLTRMSGSDLVLDLLKIAENQALCVLVVLSENGLATQEEVSHAMTQQFPSVSTHVVVLDPKKPELSSKLSADIVFVTFGAPWQEEWIYANMNTNLHFRIALGVGGSFDFLAGKLRRAPRIMRFFGMEWLWRFMLQPRHRAKRILRAVVVFPIKVFFSRFRKQ